MLKTSKPLFDSDINVGLLECTTPERYEALGRLVCHVLMYEQSRRKYKIGTTELECRQVVIHGT